MFLRLDLVVKNNIIQIFTIVQNISKLKVCVIHITKCNACNTKCFGLIPEKLDSEWFVNGPDYLLIIYLRPDKAVFLNNKGISLKLMLLFFTCDKKFVNIK